MWRRTDRYIVKESPSLWLAAVVAPFGVSVFISALMAFDWLRYFGVNGLAETLVPLLAINAVALPMAYLDMLFIGMPYVLILRALDKLNYFTVCAGGFLIGAACWVGYWSLSLNPPNTIPASIISGGMMGLCVSLFFCYAAKLPVGLSIE